MRIQSLVNSISNAILVGCFATSLLVSVSMAESETPNFSGSFTLTGRKGAQARNGEASTLQVSQTESEIEITRVTGGHQNANSCPLNGGERRYTSPGGAAGTCKARFKGRGLVLEILATTNPQHPGPVVQVHIRERWELSSDLKTLTIRSDVDYPGSPANRFTPVDWTEIYTRK